MTTTLDQQGQLVVVLEKEFETRSMLGPLCSAEHHELVAFEREQAGALLDELADDHLYVKLVGVIGGRCICGGG